MSHTVYRLPVSVKGILADSGRYLLRKNERDEWELAGGKLEGDETSNVWQTAEVFLFLREATG